MTFSQEPTYYEKTIFSDLQGAWQVLRGEIVKECAKQDCSRLMLHIDEAMSWETVRNIAYMKKIFVIIQSLSQQMNLSQDSKEAIADVKDVLDEIS